MSLPLDLTQPGAPRLLIDGADPRVVEYLACHVGGRGVWADWRRLSARSKRLHLARARRTLAELAALTRQAPR